MPARFVRRLAFAAFALFVLFTVGAAALTWLASTIWPHLARGRATLLSVPLGILWVLFFTAFMAMRRFAMPIGGIMEAADRVAGGDYEVRVQEYGPPSIRTLARAFNTMTERLQENDRVRRDLMADIAHELRTPLTVIQGKLEGLLDGVYPRNEAGLQQLLEETRLISRLVEDLRTLAQSEGGTLQLEREPTDFAALVRDVVRAFTPDAAAHSIAIEARVAAALPSIDVDALRMHQVLGNLVSNAVRHTPAGGRVTVSLAATADGGVSVDVRDTGTGMTADDLAHAFDRFYKGSQSRGSGLGLTIAKNLVVAHGGDIRASRTTGGGTTITFNVPRHR
jgi:signal transduction histidine kinase